ncbi:hypothetical protein E3V93_13840 [Microbacterium sp. 3H14]|uniref:hypothetical protein n=1 Tax=unclassified Microbacterium TaxID=2609290 RepID=UPI00106B4A38|nr:hypothetical protein [Microbacterium sp. 3H14]TFB17629.1 hypothetical protein E3V93_13840 [Microbacterium sp. 3H14]
MDEPQPELRWAPLPPPPKTAGRVWLIVGLVVAGLAIVGALLFFLLPRGAAPSPTDSPSPSPSASANPSQTPSSSPAPEPGQTPQVTAPPVVDPSVEVFRERVSGWLGDAPRGLDIIAGASGQDALPVLDTLQQDAQRMSDALPPSSIEQQWQDGVSAYATRLTQLRSAITDGSGVAAAVEAARSSVQQLRSVAGL